MPRAAQREPRSAKVREIEPPARQDVGLGATAGAVLGQVLALFFLIGMTVKALSRGWWIQALISAAALCGEI